MSKEQCLYPSHLDIVGASLSGHANANFAHMVPTGKILKRSNNLIPRGAKLPLHRHRQPPLHDEPRNLLQVLLRADHDAAHHGALGQRERRNVRHLVLRARSEEPYDGDGAAVGHGVEALRDGPRAAVFEDEVGAVAFCDLLDFFGPVGCCLVVYGVVGAVGLLDVFEFLVGG